MISEKQSRDLQLLEDVRAHPYLTEFKRVVRGALEGPKNAVTKLMDGSSKTSAGRALAAEFLQLLMKLLD